MPRCAEPSCGRWRPSFALATPLAARLWLNGRWYCSPPCIEAAARARLDAVETVAPAGLALPPRRIGALLRHMGAVDAAALERAIELQRRTGLKLGRQLRGIGAVDADTLLRALAAQSAVSYLPAFDPSRVRAAAPLSPAMVRALGLVPFDRDGDDGRLHVVCEAPVPRVAMRALAKLTGAVPVAYLVHDEVFEEALAAFCAEPERSETVTVPDLGAAAAYVVSAAAQDGTVTMRHAACDGRTWIRIEAPSRVRDLLVTGRVEL